MAKEITTQDKWSPDEFILNTLSAIYSTLKLRKDKPLSESLYKRLESLFGIGNKTINAGVSIAGFGGNYGEELNTDRLTSFSLQDFFREIVEEINNKTKTKSITRKIFKTVEMIRKYRGVFESPNPRNIALSELNPKRNIMPPKVIRRNRAACGSISAGVLRSLRMGSEK